VFTFKFGHHNAIGVGLVFWICLVANALVLIYSVVLLDFPAKCSWACSDLLACLCKVTWHNCDKPCPTTEMKCSMIQIQVHVEMMSSFCIIMPHIQYILDILNIPPY